MDLGEIQAITAVFDDGTALMYSGRLIKSIRRYWQKVRTKVKPPTAENPCKSRQYRQIERKESRQVNHLLHIMTTDFVPGSTNRILPRRVTGAAGSRRRTVFTRGCTDAPAGGGLTSM